VQFGWSNSEEEIPTQWYEPGDTYPTQRPGVTLWLNLVPLGTNPKGIYVVSGYYQTSNGEFDPIREVYPGGGGNHVDWIYPVKGRIEPGFLHLVVFRRLIGVGDCALGQFTVKIDDNGPS
ncbi:MAG TPA: hypothetical protein PLS49_06260, partial [Candidatus Woesebacteria bacterium]|nr:hypothetical protein [Candidatus Woesebacteria bacterium]